MLVKIGLLIPGMQLTSPFLGMLVDRFGEKKSAYAQAILGVTGLSLIILATAMLWDALLYVGFVVVGLQTWVAMLNVVQLGLYFEGHTVSRVIFVLNTVFDAGSITYLALWGIQEGTDASTPSILGGYLAIAIILYSISIYLWYVAVPSAGGIRASTMHAPSTRYSRLELISSSVDLEECLKNNFSAHSVKALSSYLGGSTRDLRMSRHFCAVSLASSGDMKKEKNVAVTNTAKNDARQDDNQGTSGLNKVDGEVAPETPSSYVCVADRKPREQLMSAPFMCLCIFFGLNMAACNWNLITQRDFLAGLGDDDHIYLTIFTLMTPISILGGPFIDWSILNLGWTLTLQIVNVLAIGFQVVKLASDNLNVQIVGFFIFSFYRAFLFGVSFSFLPILVSGNVIGKAAGVLAGFGGAVNLCLMPVANVAIENGDDGDFFGANLAIVSFSFPSILFICGLGRCNALEAATKEAATGSTDRISVDMIESDGENENEEDDDRDHHDDHHHDDEETSKPKAVPAEKEAPDTMEHGQDAP